jgi:hypothetical protein
MWVSGTSAASRPCAIRMRPIAWKPIGWAEEQGQIRSGVGPFLEKRMRERRAFVARQQFAARADKAVRAQAIRGRMAMEGLYVPVGAP